MRNIVSDVSLGIAWPRAGTYSEHMARLDLRQKLAILSDAAKYDASCASSGGTRRDSRDGVGLGSNEGRGICHAYAPDGRCISLLKILMTNRQKSCWNELKLKKKS